MSERWLPTVWARSQFREKMLGSVLADRCRAKDLMWEELAEYLDCDLNTVQWLCLCGKPRAESFEEDVKSIAERFELDVGKLREILSAS